MRSKMAIAGHPIHPMLVSIPVGLFAWALVADIVYAATGHDHTWYDISFWTGVAAWVTALFAALPGFGDYFTMARKSNAAGIATAHMLLNLTIVVMYIVAMVLAVNDNATSGGQFAAVIALHAAGTGLLLLSGWLGGEMVFRYHLAMVPDDTELEEAEHIHHDLRGPLGGERRQIN